MQDLLRFANYAKVADELGVHRATVSRWAAGESVPAWAVKAVERLILGEQKEAALPEWAARLRDELVREIRENRDQIVSRTGGDLTVLGQKMDEFLAESMPSGPLPDEDQAANGRRRRAAERGPRSEG